jgi:non-ribosomal peptide synthetase component F
MGMLLDYCEGRREPASPTLRVALLSGDWIPVTLPDRIRRFFDGVEVISLGGATEASIWSCFYPIGPVDPAWRSIPYGRALSAQSLLVLDAALAPVAPGVVGELFIGGAGVALGYRGDEASTARAFLRDPNTGERIYRTGDLGRWLPDGNVEFLGRNDLQVKIRGHRVELAEIEAAVLRHAAVDACAVVTRGKQGEEKELVAFHVPNRPLADDLRQHLRALLPEYMVPGRFVGLDALPLTANAKIDRSALEQHSS